MFDASTAKRNQLSFLSKKVLNSHRHCVIFWLTHTLYLLALKNEQIDNGILLQYNGLSNVGNDLINRFQIDVDNTVCKIKVILSEYRREIGVVKISQLQRSCRKG